jgi:hypothetical protein
VPIAAVKTPKRQRLYLLFIRYWGRAVGRGETMHLQTNIIQMITSYHSLYMLLGQRRCRTFFAHFQFMSIHSSESSSAGSIATTNQPDDPSVVSPEQQRAVHAASVTRYVVQEVAAI